MLNAFTPTLEAWDEFVKQQPTAHVLQLGGWGELKRKYGWQVERVALVQTENEIVAGAQLLFRDLPLGLGSMAYLPMGPYVTDESQWEPLWDAIERRAIKFRGSAFLKWEPGIFRDGQQPDFTRWKFKPSPQTVQPPRTIIIDISGTDDEIMARMNQGTRRKIRQSLKNDIRYFEGSRADVVPFTEMMQSTGDRNEFGVHTPSYYQLAYSLFAEDTDNAVLIMAEHEGDPLAGIMVFAVGDTAWYLYGASTSVKRNLMATYGVQWKAIEWARARGCTYYDMWGVPDEDEATLEAEFQQRSDGLWGVYGFKRGWGGDVVRSAGAWDRVYKPIIYGMYSAAVKILG